PASRRAHHTRTAAGARAGAPPGGAGQPREGTGGGARPPPGGGGIRGAPPGPRPGRPAPPGGAAARAPAAVRVWCARRLAGYGDGPS
ncbi:hypothetical protein, partial [Nocardia wallacei]|uniref:hypothetical protein n=1 Tax=Nocardia wallacei TaxID=480035 RepID=UPI002458C286